MKLIECVPNISEGRNTDLINQVVDTVKNDKNVHLLDVDAGFDTNRTVITFIGEPTSVIVAAFNLKEGDVSPPILNNKNSYSIIRVEKFLEERRNRRKNLTPKGPGGQPKFKLGPVKEVAAPTQVSGPYEVTLEEWVSLVKGMQINVRADGKYYMFEFDQEKDDKDEFVKWNKELDAGD